MAQVPSGAAAAESDVPEEPEPKWGIFESKAVWISILIWLTVFLGLSLTIWLDFFIGLFHTPK
jgi:hypothetical protein